MRVPITLALLLTASLAVADWRIDLLHEEGIGTTPAELAKAAARVETSTADLEASFRQLGAEDYPTRERAQARILAGGGHALKWLRAQKLPDDPEVRFRVETIRATLEAPLIGRRDRMVDHAIESLLAEAGKPASHSTGGIFYEWFGEASPRLGEHYRVCGFKADGGMSGAVIDGRLVLAGGRAGEGLQRLVLRSTEWPGKNTFPDEFRVSAKLGGTDGRAGEWHVGISVGKVRALYHPGLDGGSFRFEQDDSAAQLSSNENMGFTPSTRILQQMVVAVRKLPDGRIRLTSRVDEAGSPRYEKSLTVDAGTMGKLDQVSLDRSGRTGGDAIFDDLAIEFPER